MDISISIMELQTLLHHHWRKTHHLMIPSLGYHPNKVLMNPYLNFVDVLTNINLLSMNNPHFNLLFNVDQLTSISRVLPNNIYGDRPLVMSTMMITTDTFVSTYPQGFFQSGTETQHV